MIDDQPVQPGRIFVTKEEAAQLSARAKQFSSTVRAMYTVELQSVAAQLGVSLTDAFRITGGRFIIPALRGAPPVGHTFTRDDRAEALFREIMTHPDTNGDLQIAVGLAFRTPSTLMAGIELKNEIPTV